MSIVMNFLLIVLTVIQIVGCVLPGATMATGGIIGTVPPFDPAHLSFEEWFEILDAFFVTNEIVNAERKKAVFLTTLGTKTYHLLRSILQPSKPTDKTLPQCVKALNDHFKPQTSEIIKRFKFNTRNQKEGESIVKYVAELRYLSDGCKFRDLEDMLRDRIVVGVQDMQLQRKLLSVKDLNFDKAYQIACAMETANKDIQDIKKVQSGGATAKVHKVYAKKSAKPERGKSHGQSHQSKPSSSSSKTPKYNCWRCGNQSHFANECPFIREKCHKCSKIGHTQSQCDKVKKYFETKKGSRAHHVEEGDSDFSDSDCEQQCEYQEYGGYLRHISVETLLESAVNRVEAINLQIWVNSQKTQFELDTGCPWSIISKSVYDKLKLPPIQAKSVSLRDYNGSPVHILGSVDVKTQLTSDGQVITLPLLVASKGVSLCGRDWIDKLRIPIREAVDSALSRDSDVSIPETHVVAECLSLDSILDQEGEVFNTSELGKLQGYQAKVYPVEGVKPAFYKPSSVAYATKVKLDKALDDLLDQGVIEPVRYADFACPLVIAKKPDGNIRVCGNYKVTANKILRVEKYPIPSLEDLLMSLQGGQKFSKIDLSHAYHQVELEESARKYTTINTHRGLFQYCRLPFGIASAPAIFQRTMESLLGDIPMCKAYLDDIIISGRNDVEHLQNLQKVLARLRENGLKLKKEKCAFMQDSVQYLGHQLDASGIKPEPGKVAAIKEAPRPRNQEELQSFLGLLGYYRKFIPSLSKHIAPLNLLLQKKFKTSRKPGQQPNSQPFPWGSEQQAAFDKAKELLSSDTLLVHYNPNWPVLLQCDASPYGLGSVISHVLPNGEERPIAFASRSLSPSEKNYAQYEREALAIVFGLGKFHKYLHGRFFTIVTDHKPLIQVFGDKPISSMASARIIRWQMLLGAYQYDICYKPGKEHCNADGLSRLPITDTPATEVSHINLLADIDSSPITASEIRASIKKDLVLSKVRGYLREGWPDKKALDASFQPFYTKREELSIEDDMVLYGERVVIPNDNELKQCLLAELHSCHPGIVKMKLLARSYIWWPNIDDALENQVKVCTECQENQRSPSKIPIHPWEFPENPWERVHLDYAQIDDKEVLIAVDAFSKWIEAIPMSSTTAQATIKVVRQLFARHGIPETIVTDNGPQFVSQEFFDFLTKNGVNFVQTPPKHPASNGLAERAVQTVKRGVLKTAGSLEERLEKFLLMYRVTPQCTTGKMPCELLMRRRLRTRLDLVKPSLRKKVKHSQSNMKSYAGGKDRKIGIDDHVLVKNFSSGPTWLKGVVTDTVNECILEVKLEDGRVVRRHIDQVQKRVRPSIVDDNLDEPRVVAKPDIPISHQSVIPNDSGENNDNGSNEDPTTTVPECPVPEMVVSENHEAEHQNVDAEMHNPRMPVVNVERRMSSRVKTQPVRFKDFQMYK